MMHLSILCLCMDGGAGRWERVGMGGDFDIFKNITPSPLQKLSLSPGVIDTIMYKLT